jgi:hypothetical protein
LHIVVKGALDIDRTQGMTEIDCRVGGLCHDLGDCVLGCVGDCHDVCSCWCVALAAHASIIGEQAKNLKIYLHLLRVFALRTLDIKIGDISAL